MRSLIMAAAAFGLLASPVVAASKGGNDKMSVCAAAWRAAPAAEKAGTTYRAYSSACMKGAGPAASKADPDAEARADPATAEVKPVKRARVSKAKSTAPAGEGLPAIKPADATAQCKDDTYSSAKSHAGACAGHGGVASWL